MEVLVGSTFGHGMVRDRSGVAAQDKDVPTALLLTEEPSGGGSRIGLRRCVRSTPEEISESWSSVGVSGGSSGNEEEDDAVSSHGGRWLGSFSSSLEDSLPIKRGLSNHYVGKSKSFGNLMEASNAKDLEKVESPLNKRRRLLIANKLRRRSMSLSASGIFTKFNPNSMPLLALQESDEEDHKHNNDNDNDDDDDDSSDDETLKLQEKRMKMTNNRDFMVQTQSCFCLTSLRDGGDR